MEDQQPSRQSRKKRRLRKGRIFFLILLVFAMTVSIYSVVQYRAGLSLAKDQTKKQEEFKGHPVDPLNPDIENTLLLGVDSRGEEKSRTDTMIVVSLNKKTNEVKLVSFMRDIYATIPGYKSYKLNTAYYLGGAELLQETIYEMFQLPIQHYALVDFKSFESLVDILAPDGVPMNVEKDMSELIDVELKAGQQVLNGKELLGYARFRHDAEGDFGRVERQQQVMEALKKELVKPKNILNYPKLLGAAQGFVQTDLTTKQQFHYLRVLAKGNEDATSKLTIPIEGSFSYKSYPHAGSVIVIDQKANTEAIYKFLGMSTE